MFLRRVGLGVGALTIGLSLGVAPIATVEAGAAKHSTGLKAGTCGALTKEQSQATKLSTSLESAFASGNLGKIKVAVLADLNTLSSAISRFGSFLGGLPSNVRAAFNTLSHAFSGLKTSVQHANSLSQLESAFTALGTNPKVEAASATLDGYFGTRCGLSTPTT